MNEQRKKICFITTISVTLETFVLEVAKYFYENSNYDITMICDKNEEFKNKLPDYIKYIPISMKRGVSLSGIRSIIEMYKVFKKEKFDLIQYSTPNASFYASIAGKLAKIKRRLYCQWGIRYLGFSGLKRKIFKIVEKITCKNSTWIEAVSYSNLECAYEEGLYNKDISSIVWKGSASGIDLEKFDIEKKEKWRKKIRDKYQIDEKTVVIGFAGRIERDKGVNELLRVFKKLLNTHKNLKLLVIGNEDKIQTIKKDIWEWAKKQKEIIFTGRVNDIEEYYAAMDIFTLPSYREGFGNVIIEAEAMGVPVIVTNIPGPIDAMIENKTGLLVKKADENSLMKALQTLISNKEKRDYMGKEGTRFVKENFESGKLFKFILEDRKRLLKY